MSYPSVNFARDYETHSRENTLFFSQQPYDLPERVGKHRRIAYLTLRRIHAT